MYLTAFQDESYCLKTQAHKRAHSGTNHYCYRCGMFLGHCDCMKLGSPLDY